MQENIGIERERALAANDYYYNLRSNMYTDFLENSAEQY